MDTFDTNGAARSAKRKNEGAKSQTGYKELHRGESQRFTRGCTWVGEAACHGSAGRRDSHIGKSSGLSDSVQQGELANSTALTAIAQQQAGRSDQLFNTAYPGFQQAESFYQTIASGDPGKIATAIAPATQQISQASDQAKANILRTGPAGGEKNLALEQVDVNQGAEVGKTASGSYLNSFNALASLAGQGVGESTAAAGTGISGYSSANQGLGALGQQQIQQKGAQLGALTSLGSDAATVGAAFI